MTKQVIFFCNTCADYNKHKQGEKFFNRATTEIQSLTEAWQEHVMYGHDVVLRYEELNEDD